MKDLGDASYILGIKLMQDCKNKRLALSQASFIEKILAHFNMQNSKKMSMPFRHGVHLSPCLEEIEHIKQVPYALAIGSLMYAMVCMRLDIYYVVGMVSRYQTNPGSLHWATVKDIFKYL